MGMRSWGMHPAELHHQAELKFHSDRNTDSSILEKKYTSPDLSANDDTCQDCIILSSIHLLTWMCNYLDQGREVYFHPVCLLVGWIVSRCSQKLQDGVQLNLAGGCEWAKEHLIQFWCRSRSRGESRNVSVTFQNRPFSPVNNSVHESWWENSRSQYNLDELWSQSITKMHIHK